ncbi:hypothetical protein TNCV_4000182 [Trichonephila clavipes]|nr:hypothetical protein TNCV_4000182 [Trichonephila clavipes]
MKPVKCLHQHDFERKSCVVCLVTLKLLTELQESTPPIRLHHSLYYCDPKSQFQHQIELTIQQCLCQQRRSRQTSNLVMEEQPKALIMIDKAWRAVTPLTIHSCFKKSGFPSPNLVDVDDTLTELNAEPSLREALPKQDLTFDDYELVTTTLLYGEPYRTLKLWLWTTIIQKVMKTNRRS